MLRFFRIRSKSFIRLTWILLFILAADTVNLDDFILSSVNLHLDDIDMAVSSNGYNTAADNVGHARSALQEMAANTAPAQKNQKDCYILYDLDSLAFAASASFEKETVLEYSGFITAEPVSPGTFSCGNPHELFLLNGSLLI